MGAAVEGVVRDQRVAGLERFQLSVLHRPHQGQNALAHRAQVHGDVRGIGHQAPAAIEQGAGEIKALLDVHRDARLLQTRPHLLGDRHEAMAKQLQIDRVRFAHPHGAAAESICLLEGQEQFAAGQATGTPAGRQQVRSRGLTDQGGPLQHLTSRDRIALPEGGGPPGAIEIEGHLARLGTIGGDGHRLGLSAGTGPAELHTQAVHDDLQRIAAGEVAIALLELGDELLPQFLDPGARAGPQQGQALIPSGQAQLQGPLHLGPGRHRGKPFSGDRLELRQAAGGQWATAGVLEHLPLVGQANPIGREHPREGMQQHLLHPQPFSQRTGVLTAGPTEAAEHRLTHVMALLDRDAANRLRHPLEGELQGPLGSRFRGAVQALAEDLELVANGLRIKGLIAR